MKYKCDCCGIEADFETPEAAFEAGWDAQPYFKDHTACNLCPQFLIITDMTWRHVPIHERWEREGRPEIFDQETCLAPEDRVPAEDIEKLKSKIAPERAVEIKRFLSNMLTASRKDQERDLNYLHRWSEAPRKLAWTAKDE